jgi:hypothetical protein
LVATVSGFLTVGLSNVRNFQDYQTESRDNLQLVATVSAVLTVGLSDVRNFQDYQKEFLTQSQDALARKNEPTVRKPLTVMATRFALLREMVSLIYNLLLGTTPETSGRKKTRP